MTQPDELERVRVQLRELGYLSHRVDRLLLQDALRPAEAWQATPRLAIRIGILAGLPVVLDWFPDWVPEPITDTVRSFSFLTHFAAIARGVVDARDLLFFGSLIGCFLFGNAVLVDLKKAD